MMEPRYGADRPAAVVAFASRREQRCIRCRLADLGDRMRAVDIVSTAVIFVGPVLAAAGFVDGYLSSKARLAKLQQTR